MELIDIFNWCVIVGSASIVAYEIVRGLYKAATYKRLQITNRKNGKSVIVSRKMTHDDIKKINTLFH